MSWIIPIVYAPIDCAVVIEAAPKPNREAYHSLNKTIVHSSVPSALEVTGILY